MSIIKFLINSPLQKVLKTEQCFLSAKWLVVRGSQKGALQIESYPILDCRDLEYLKIASKQEPM